MSPRKNWYLKSFATMAKSLGYPPEYFLDTAGKKKITTIVQKDKKKERTIFWYFAFTDTIFWAPLVSPVRTASRTVPLVTVKKKFCTTLVKYRS